MDARIEKIVDAIGRVLLGKKEQISLALACMVAGGHLLIEDLPGMGKTILANALARSLGLSCNRIQFTSDLLPADILGVSVFDREGSGFRFHPGPIFAQVVMADEINRTTPKTQSALLEAMEEGQVSVDGETRPLPEPFFVIATQNPAFQTGTYPLPESQLDRFLMRVVLGYPDIQAERQLLRGEDRRILLRALEPVGSPALLRELRTTVEQVRASEPLVEYVHRLVLRSREDPAFGFGLSPRGALALIRASRAWALLQGRGHVLPEDVQAVLPAVAEHRLRDASGSLLERDGDSLARRLLACVDVVN